MRQHRLLSLGERGTAVIQFPVAVLLLMMFTIGVAQVAFALYGKNVIASSAHEGARAAAENGRSLSDARVIATEVIRRATGKMTERLQVHVEGRSVLGGGKAVRVEVRAALRPWGLVPLSIPITSRAEVTNPRAGW